MYNIKKLEKLIEIWSKADQELEQCRKSFGNRATKEACAIGAIMFYEGRTDVDDLNDENSHNWQEIQRLSFTETLNMLEDESEVFPDEITELNDIHSWTFRNFAEATRTILEREKGEHGSKS